MSLHSLSLQLETVARKIINFSNRPIGTMYDADSIERGNFIEIMILLLKVKNNFAENEKIENFADRYHSYAGKPMTDIGMECASAIYDEFEALLSSLAK